MGQENAKMWAKYIGVEVPDEEDYPKLMDNFILNSDASLHGEKDSK